MPVCYSEGYHPRPKMSMGRALPVGMESDCEYLDVVLTRREDSTTLADRLNDAAPDGIRFSGIREVEGRASLEDAIAASTYEMRLPDGVDRARAADNYRGRDSCEIEVTRKGKKRSVDMKQVITELAVSDDSVIRLTISHRGPSVKVGEALKAVFGLTEDELRVVPIRKVGVAFDAQ